MRVECVCVRERGGESVCMCICTKGEEEKFEEERGEADDLKRERRRRGKKKVVNSFATKRKSEGARVVPLHLSPISSSFLVVFDLPTDPLALYTVA